MGERDRARAACPRKVGYDTYAEACIVAGRANRPKRGKPRRVPISVYRCAECRKWHVGNDVELKTKARTNARADRKRTRARLRSEWKG